MTFGSVESEEKVDEESEEVSCSRVHADTPVAVRTRGQSVTCSRMKNGEEEENKHDEGESERAEEEERNRDDRLSEDVNSTSVQTISTFSNKHGSFFEEGGNTGD